MPARRPNVLERMFDRQVSPQKFFSIRDTRARAQFAGKGAEVYPGTGSEKDSAVAELLRLASTPDKAALQQFGKLREATALPAHLAALPDANGEGDLQLARKCSGGQEFEAGADAV